MRGVMVRGAGAGAVLVLLSGALSAQQPPAPQPGLRQGSGGQAAQTFKSGTEVVQVDVRVFDKDGRFVTDLKPEDFEIKEDGVPQPIVNLTLVGGSTAPRTAPGTSTSTRGTSTPAPGTLAPGTPTWVFLFDTLHLSPGGLDRARKAVEAFVSTRLPEGAVAGVIANGRMANNRLTSNREELVKAVHDIKVPETAFTYQMQMTREWPRFQDEFEAWMIAVHNDNDTLQRVVIRACSDDPDQCKRASPDLTIRDKAKQIERAAEASARLSLEVARGLSNGLGKMAGPKTVVFLSEGFILQEMESELRDVSGLANRGGAHFYTIDARGLNKGTSSSSIIDQPAAFDPAGAPGKIDLQEDGTNALAVDTGGMAIRNENNIGRALDVVAEDASTYYVIGYTPANQSWDGKYRAISVTVKRLGVKVRARRGYLALEPAKLLRPTVVTPAPQTGVEPTSPVSTAAGSPAAPNAEAASNAPAPGAPAAAGPPVGPPPSSGEAADSPAPTAATALRTTIESRGFVEQLQQSAERLSPTKLDDLAGKGWTAYEKGDVEHAATYLGQAATSPDARPWVRYALGLAHLALGHYPDAVRAWEEVRRDVPDFEPVYFNLADGYLLQKDEGDALKILRDAQRWWPQDPEVWNATGVLQVRRGALDAAIESFTRATSVAPSDSLGVFNLARAYQMRAAKSQRYDSAMQKWVGGEGDRKKAQENYEKYVRMGGPFVQQAKDALAALAWTGQ